MQRPSRSRMVAAAIVVAAHLVLLIAWTQDAVRWPGHAAPPRISVRLIAAAPPAAPQRPADAPMARPARESSRRTQGAARGFAVEQGLGGGGFHGCRLRGRGVGGDGDGDGLRSDGLWSQTLGARRALRASARDPGLAARAGRIGPAPLAPDERLGAEVLKSARGDCLKGEYLGGGMGLLSLPFLAAAALREQCRR